MQEAFFLPFIHNQSVLKLLLSEIVEAHCFLSSAERRLHKAQPWPRRSLWKSQSEAGATWLLAGRLRTGKGQENACVWV